MNDETEFLNLMNQVDPVSLSEGKDEGEGGEGVAGDEGYEEGNEDSSICGIFRKV